MSTGGTAPIKQTQPNSANATQSHQTQPYKRLSKVAKMRTGSKMPTMMLEKEDKVSIVLDLLHYQTFNMLLLRSLLNPSLQSVCILPERIRITTEQLMKLLRRYVVLFTTCVVELTGLVEIALYRCLCSNRDTSLPRMYQPTLRSHK